MPNTSDKIKLLCWILGDGPDHIFAIRVGLSNSVIELKEAILEKNPSFQNAIDAHYLEPWKVGELCWHPSVHDPDSSEGFSTLCEHHKRF